MEKRSRARGKGVVMTTILIDHDMQFQRGKAYENMRNDDSFKMDTMMLSRASYRYVQNRSRNRRNCVKGNQTRFCVTVVDSVTVEKMAGPYLAKSERYTELFRA
jgi:hypothetical protein